MDPVSILLMFTGIGGIILLIFGFAEIFKFKKDRGIRWLLLFAWAIGAAALSINMFING